MTNREKLTALFQQRMEIEQEERRVAADVMADPESDWMIRAHATLILDGDAPQPLGWQVDRVFWADDALHEDGFRRGFCGVSVAGDNRRFLGVYLGDVAVGIAMRHDPESKSLIVQRATYNPAILIPSLNRVVLGLESWHGSIQKAEELDGLVGAEEGSLWRAAAVTALESK